MNKLHSGDISLIISSRNNLKYLKWCYDSLRKNDSKEIEICIADDFSSDGTWQWCLEIMQQDSNFKAIRNEGPSRLGHTILFDTLIKEVATRSIVGIFHADMYCAPDAVSRILQYIEPGTVVSLTRVEPPLHPRGPEKILADFGTEPENFKEDSFLQWFGHHYPSLDGGLYYNNITEGVFAPWFIFKKDFDACGGHDSLFAPQSKEDSDIFNRFKLRGYRFIQLWSSLVYHLTCRGSRFNPTITSVGTNSEEWVIQNYKSARNFIRKWGHSVLHDAYMKPIVPPKYDVGIVLRGGLPLLKSLEPWCSTIYLVDSYDIIASDYIKEEQPNTLYVLSARIKHAQFSTIDNGIVIYVNEQTFKEDDFNFIKNLSLYFENLIKNGNKNELSGKFEIGNLELEVNSLTTLNCDFVF